MADVKPTVLLLHGDEVFAREAFLAGLLRKQGDNATLNVQRLSTDSVSLDEVAQACAIMPFLGERRVVILHKPSRWCEEAERWKRERWLICSNPCTSKPLSSGRMGRSTTSLPSARRARSEYPSPK